MTEDPNAGPIIGYLEQIAQHDGGTALDVESWTDFVRRIKAVLKTRADDRYECMVMSAITGRLDGETLTAAVDRVCRENTQLRNSLRSLIARLETVEYDERFAAGDTAAIEEACKALAAASP